MHICARFYLNIFIALVVYYNNSECFIAMRNNIEFEHNLMLLTIVALIYYGILELFNLNEIEQEERDREEQEREREWERERVQERERKREREREGERERKSEWERKSEEERDRKKKRDQDREREREQEQDQEEKKDEKEEGEEDEEDNGENNTQENNIACHIPSKRIKTKKLDETYFKEKLRICERKRKFSYYSSNNKNVLNLTLIVDRNWFDAYQAEVKESIHYNTSEDEDVDAE